MKKGELIVAALFILVAAVVIGDTYRIGSGWTEYGPDAGFVPMWEGVLMMVSAIVVFLSGLKAKGGTNFFTSSQGLWEVVRIAFTAVLLTIGIVFLGVYISTILYGTMFARWLGKHRWPASIAFALILTFAIFFGMEKGLKLTLPKSPLYWKGLFIF